MMWLVMMMMMMMMRGKSAMIEGLSWSGVARWVLYMLGCWEPMLRRDLIPWNM